jgi:tetratricopeptide (TPR) repeat protein
MMQPLRIAKASAVVLLFLVAARITVTASDASPSSLACETNENGSIQCSFTIHPEQIKHERHTIIALEDCLEDDSACIRADVSITNVRRKKNESDRQLLQSSSGTYYTLDDTGITLGRIKYSKPYSQYVYDIASSLVKLEFNVKAVRDDTNMIVKAKEEAELFITIGAIHRSLLQDYFDECEDQQRISGRSMIFDMERVQEMADQTSNAFEQAVKVHQIQLYGIPPNKNDKTRQQKDTELVHSLFIANIYFYMSDLWSLVARFDKDKRQFAKEYMIEAMELFNFCKDANLDELAKEDDNDNEDSVVHITFTRMDQLDAAYYWGQCLIRLGMLQMSVTNVLQIQHEQATMNDLLEEFNNEYNQDELLERLTSGAQDMTNSIQESIDYFQRAAEFFGPALESFKFADEVIHPADMLLYQISLASALQHMGENKILLGQQAQGTDDFERALEIYDEILHNPRHAQAAELQDARLSVADLMFSLSRAFLQQAKYDKASHYYERAMDWHETHEISPPNNAGDLYKLPESEGTIDEYEQLLEEYKMLRNGASDVLLPEEVAGYDDERGFALEADEKYESAIHSTLGYLYMSNGDIYQASSHMSQALFLFRNSAEEQDATLGDLLYNMAVLKFSTGEFKESASYFTQAVEVFRDAVPEGENPLSRSLDSFDLDSILSTMQAESEQAEVMLRTESMDQSDEPPFKRKVLTLQMIENEPAKPTQQAETRIVKSSGHPRLNFNYEAIRRQLLNETRDEL